MTRRRSRTALALVVLLACATGCVSPFEPHAQDVRNAFGRQAESAHRKWDRYVLGLDWDDPRIEWVDPSYATGPMHDH